jgi:hypothetical protein
MSDAEDNARAIARIDHRRGVNEIERERFLAEDLLPGPRSCLNHRTMQRMRRRDNYRLNLGII